jgi:CheY-like chemotaxis protein
MRARSPDVPVVIITAHGTDADEAECRAEGARAFLGKPIDIDELTSLIDELGGASP